MKKKKILLIIVGLLLFLMPYLLNVYTIYRSLIAMLGIGLIVFGIVIDKQDKIWRVVFLPILFIVLAFLLDYGVAHLFDTIPMFATKAQSSEDVITYNSIMYRKFSCGKKLILDDFYEKSYPCDNLDLKTFDVTSFLNSVLENYRDYKDKFVKIEGKISKINGTYNLELQGYTTTEDSINGYVLFSDSATIEVNFNEIKDLTSYKVYDSITVIGRIDELIKKGDNYILRMNDSIILDSNLYETYELSATPKNSCVNDKDKYEVVDDKTYYISCLEGVYVKYDDENIYDLSYVLRDKRMTFDNLVSLSKNKVEEKDSALYEYEDFNILKCANQKEIIIGNKDLKIDSSYCGSEEPNTDEEL